MKEEHEAQLCRLFGGLGGEKGLHYWSNDLVTRLAKAEAKAVFSPEAVGRSAIEGHLNSREDCSVPPCHLAVCAIIRHMEKRGPYCSATTSGAHVTDENHSGLRIN